MALPSQQNFLRKFLLALLSEPVVCNGYFRRFQIKDLAGFSRLSYFGGYPLYSKLIKAVPVNPDDHVLDIGPWTGLECFLLSEVYKKVSVAEPDSEIASQLRAIAQHYRTDDGRLASEALNIHQMGVGLRGVQSTLRLPGINAGTCSGLTLSGAFRPRLERRGLAPSNGSKCTVKRSVKFDVSGASEISDLLGHHFADRVFCNHVIRVIPQEPKLPVLLSSLASYCNNKGVLTWADSPAELTYALLEYVTFPDDSDALEELCEQHPGDREHPWVPYMTVSRIKKMISPLLPDFSFGIRTIVTRSQGIDQAAYLIVAKRK